MVVLEVFDRRSSPDYPAPPPEAVKPDLLDGITLEPHQVDALKSMLKNEIGIISAVTGAGKTEIMAGMVKLMRCPTVIITEQLVVLDQIVERLRIRKTTFKTDSLVLM